MSITFYEQAGFTGKCFMITESNSDFAKADFNAKATSVRVSSGTWLLYEHVNFEGRSYQVSSRGTYDFSEISAAIGTDVVASAKLASSQLTLFQQANYQCKESHYL